MGLICKVITALYTWRRKTETERQEKGREDVKQPSSA